MDMLSHLSEASHSGAPVDLLLTNGHRVTGIPDVRYPNSDSSTPPETVCISTSYEYLAPGHSDRITANEAGYWINPDKPPTHVRLDHISTFAYKED